MESDDVLVIVVVMDFDSGLTRINVLDVGLDLLFHINLPKIQ